MSQTKLDEMPVLFSFLLHSVQGSAAPQQQRPNGCEQHISELKDETTSPVEVNVTVTHPKPRGHLIADVTALLMLCTLTGVSLAYAVKDARSGVLVSVLWG